MAHWVGRVREEARPPPGRARRRPARREDAHMITSIDSWFMRQGTSQYVIHALADGHPPSRFRGGERRRNFFFAFHVIHPWPAT